MNMTNADFSYVILLMRNEYVCSIYIHISINNSQ